MKAAAHAVTPPPAMRRATSVVLLAAFILSPHGVLADALPDAGAAAAHRASVSAVGGVPVVNITAPDNAGVSHNKWQQFSVPVQGMVLNNAPSGATSSLAGPLAANPGLGTAARLILNEVTSNQPSTLLGPLEVAGPAARMVIANPNGITCNGCGFINTPHVTLTTGRPELIDGALRLDVTQGRIDIGDSGLAALAVRIDLIAAAVRSDGPVSTQSDLNVLAGRFYADAETLVQSDAGRASAGPHAGAADSGFAIDIGQSVSANSIQLIVLGSQIGVRSSAALSAVRDITVASRDKMQLGGSLSAGGDIGIYNIGAWHSVVDGAIDAGGDLQILAMDLTVTTAGSLKANGRIELGFQPDNSDGWSSFVNAGRIDAGGSIAISGVRSGLNAGVMTAGGSLDAAGTTVLPKSGAAGLAGAYSGRDPGSDEVVLVNTGTLEAGEDLFVNLVENDGGTLVAGRHAFVWQSRRGAFNDLHPAPGGLTGSITAGEDLFLFAPADVDDPVAVVSLQRFIAGNDLYLLPAPWLSHSHSTLRADVLAGDAQAADSVTRPYVNRDVLAAARDIYIAIPATFENQALVEAGRDLHIVAAGVLNATRIDTVHESFDYERFEDCQTTYYGVCSADIEQPGEGALMVAGRDLVVDAPRFHNRGATVLGGRNIDIASNDFLNEDRRYGAVWSATYYAVDIHAQAESGESCSTNSDVCAAPIDWLRTRSGEVPLGVLPGIIQAGLTFSSDTFPRSAPALPVDDNGSAGSPAASTTTTSPSPSPTPLAVPRSQVGDRLADILAQVLASGAGSLDAVPSPLSTFVNTGSIHAASIVVRADDIRNGFDVVKDYYHRTAELALPPASIDVAAFGTQGGVALNASDYSGEALMRLLPPSLASDVPFALTAEEEETALRNAFLATTHLGWILPGLSWDAVTGQSPEAQQHAILAANGAAFAIEHEIAMGHALSAGEQALLTVPVLWYVERDGGLYPWVYLPSEWQSQLAVIPGGTLDAGVAIVLAGKHIDNTGFVLSDGLLSVTADELENRKRSAYYYEEFEVSGGTLIVEGSQVQPGGFMQAAEWDLNVASIHSLSGEFRVLGDSAQDTLLLSRAFEAQIAAELGDDFIYEVARDDLHIRFEKKMGLGDIAGMAASFIIASYIGADISSFIGGFAGEGSTFAAATAGSSVGLGNLVATHFITQAVSGSIGQFIATGQIDPGAALNSGLAAGLTAGMTPWTGSGLSQSFEQFALRSITAGAIGELTGTSFEAALLNSVVSQAAALGANEIGGGNFGEQGSLGHLLAHGALGALTEAARGGDALSGALGAMTATLVEQPFDEALGLQGADREIVLTALTMLSGGLVAGVAGGDAVAGGFAAQNVTANNYLKHAEAKEIAGLKNLKLLGKCDEKCLNDIQRLEALDDERNRQLADCEGMATSACDAARQAVRSAAAEYLRANDQTQLLRLVDDYAVEQGETLLLAQSTMDDVLLGKVQGYTDAVVDGLVSAASAAYTGFKALMQDPQAQDQVREGAGAAYDYLKNPENWPYLLGALTPEAREELARAYEVGDGQAVGSLMGTAVAGLPIGGGFGAIKKIDNVVAGAANSAESLSGLGLGYRIDLPKHLAGPDGFTKSGQLSGTHNLVNATAALDAKGASYSLMPTDTAGLSVLKYSYTNPATGKVVSGSKTVYDPAVFSDQKMLDLSLKAGQKGWEHYLLNKTLTSFDVSSGGVKFRTYINFDKFGNPYVGNVHPIK